MTPEYTAAYSINRNIVECKGRKQDKKGRAGLSINRNIVECKGLKNALQQVKDKY